jgi:GntR family transcriptional regulator of vanillate catabolism
MSDDAQSQNLKAILGLRGMIVDGLIAPGARVSELLLVEKLGISRTPARIALVQLRNEGLLEALPTGGFVVASFSELDILEAIEIRGTLEGMAARYAAERGVSPAMLAPAEKCLAELDKVMAQPDDTFDLNDYVRLNDKFHELIVECAQSNMIKRSLERIMSLPFAAPNAFISSSRSNSPHVRGILYVSQEQHRSIVDAIRNRQGTRAESLAIEHSRSAWKYLELALRDDETVAEWPSLALLRRRAS